MRNPRVEKLVKMALLCAMSLALMYVVRFPLILAYLEYDMADVPILIGSFLFGPIAGLALTAIVSFLQAVTVSAASGWIGGVMHFFATGAFVLVAGLVYRGKHTLGGALAGLLLGSLAMILVMVPLNYYLSPLFLVSAEMDYAAAQGYLWSIMWSFVAFNAAKTGINSVVTYLIYKPVSRLFKREFFAAKGQRR
ncbi:MAG TPA: ECF transporter S component [Clostridia bacterium]|nr:ECF transporter S component [Clostridia bacterium]